MTIALVAALLIGEFVIVLVIVFFVLIAEVLEGLTLGRGRRAIKDLLDLLPRVVRVRRKGSVGELDASRLRAGDFVLIEPGARIPVDGWSSTGTRSWTRRRSPESRSRREGPRCRVDGRSPRARASRPALRERTEPDAQWVVFSFTASR